jgi:NAD(P)-dependent dehydrogenase (short-subunit alcohol dehydrogenase family)
MNPPSQKKTVLVTGATSGFGFEATRLLAQEGWRVYAGYRNIRKWGPLHELSKTMDVHPIYLEVTKPASVKNALKVIGRKEGVLDALVNNAGFVVAGFLEDLSDKDLKAQFDTNVFGLLRVTRESVPLLKLRGGTVVNVGSISGRVSFPGIGAYVASKFAVRSLSEGLRQELRPFGIRVSEVAPGTYATGVVGSAQYGEGAQKSSSPYAPYQRQVEELMKKEFTKARPASEVAELILRILNSPKPRPVYLAGPDAKFMAWLKWFLPDRVFESVFGSFFPWSKKT